MQNQKYTSEEIEKMIVEKSNLPLNNDEKSKIYTYIKVTENITKSSLMQVYCTTNKIYKLDSLIIVRFLDEKFYEFVVFIEIVEDFLKLLLSFPLDKKISECIKKIESLAGVRDYSIYFPSLPEELVIKTETDYIPFSNTIVDVEDKKEKIIINKKNIINNDFEYLDDKTSIFEQFVDKAFLDSYLAKVTIGYLCSVAKMKFFNKLVIIEDQASNDNNSTDGRRGKSLLINTLIKSKMLNSFYINGKEFTFENRFKFSGYEYKKSPCVFIDDVARSFDMELLFSCITQDIITVESKNKNRLDIDGCPKFVLTSNRPIKIDSGSASARVIKLVMSDYFSVDYTPLDEFGCVFIDEWDKDEKNRFYSFIIKCICLFIDDCNYEIKQDFNNDVIKSQNNISIAGSYGVEFIDFINENIKENMKIEDAYHLFVSWCNNLNHNVIQINYFSKKVQIITGMISYRPSHNVKRIFIFKKNIK